MDSEKLSKQYIEDYNQLVDKYKNSEIKKVVAGINEAIHTGDKQKVEECYLKIQTWNFDVADLENRRVALNAQFRHLHLPSVQMFTIIYDGIVKYWKFNTDIE
ncbi:hypothetical protein [Dysgonomonas macrotermitis]|uniref:Uncharacterized protein n=1 Tax=Dysgonomonas macrotermitis TaxID=1346286 RepID=A0A1M4ZB89_9BACT|nr:hypothetical protein [Dysgonomonas macrotermitis]SHF14846.1 hypothetical protein SAMN05444362_10426 [Dysgonomonas macrotermitis]